jgi:hypothetical protein
MTDWDEILEYIRNAIEAVDEAHSASHALRQEANPQTFDALRTKLAGLEEHLQKLKTVLDNEEAFAMDELMDALSKVYSGHLADYRRTPRMKD